MSDEESTATQSRSEDFREWAYPFTIPEDSMRISERPPVKLEVTNTENGTHFGESQFVMMVLRGDEELIRQYLLELCLSWPKIRGDQRSIHWKRLHILSTLENVEDFVTGAIRFVSQLLHAQISE
jgi:hypothetical protein